MVTISALTRILVTLALPWLAAEAISATSAQSWYEALAQKEPSSGAFVHRILIVQEIRDGHLISLSLDRETFTEGTYFDLIDARESETVFRLNRRGEDIQDYVNEGNKPEDLFTSAFRFTNADTIIWASPESEHWIFYRPDAQLVAKKEFMIKGPEQKDAGAVKKWLVEKLGYNGVLLAREDNLMLVATYADAKESGSAMLVKESAGLLRVKKSQSAGAALLQRRDCYRNVCVFEVMIKGADSYPVGSKVFF